MATKPLPSPELLRQLLRYDPETGKLFWRTRGVEYFKSGFHGIEAHCASWNTKYAGREAGSANTSRGQIAVALVGTKVLAHRAIWAMCYSEWPAIIDHIDGDPGNNRLSNLRNVTQQENMRNMAMLACNTSGHTGVAWMRHRSKWRAFISVDDRQIHLGSFRIKQDAIAARKAAEREYGFHPNHGRTT